MKKFTDISIKIFCLVCVIISWSCSKSDDQKNIALTNEKQTDFTYAQNTLPPDPKQSCTLSGSDFNSWFASGTPSTNGAVNAANSVQFTNTGNCDFYKWSEQMFLWLTSPTGNGSITLLSPTFYTVLPDSTLQKRKFAFFAASRSSNGSLSRQLIQNDPKKPLQAVAFLGKDKKAQTTEAQAGNSNALIAQNGSLVYYITFVNDMFAYFASGVKAGKLDGSKFPTTAADRDAIMNYARQNKLAIPSDSNALTLEIKTSWVELDSIPSSERGNFITAQVIIPTYTKSSQQWVPNSSRKATLALVGIHVVGSVAGHPEMIWATLEHHSSTPNASYPYINTKGDSVTVPQDTGNNWIFSNNAADANPNMSKMTVDSVGNINATKETVPISASNTLRYFVWGSNPAVQPNQLDSSAAASNSELISFNNSIRSLWSSADIRKNYLFMGATWTRKGTAPNGNSFPPFADGVAIGTSQLANSSMETSFQGPTSFGGSCFGCHNGTDSEGNPSLNPSVISHIFKSIKPIRAKK